MSAQQKEEDVQIRIKPSVKKMVDEAKIIPQESYSDCIKRVLIGYQKYQKKQLITDMDRIAKTGKFVPWDEAKKELGL